MMQQYFKIKEENKDSILFFRLGDFYEMFYDDAKLASKELELTLTGRDCGQAERAPMCGVPFHSCEGYIARLVAKGYKVAICEQLEDPALAKGLVKRDITRIVTPGTVLESSMLDESRNNYFACVYGEDGSRIVEFHFDGVFEDILSRVGEMPLPPYIKEKLTDKTRYNTVYSKIDGSAAAPTAGLHFTKELIDKLKAKGVIFVEVLLHVGLGTFRPVKVDDVTKHHMHSEFYSVSEQAANEINAAKAEGRRVICVGTTSVRTLESAADRPGHIVAGSGNTDIFIYPPYKYKMVDALITNFHLPESTLIMLVSALCSREEILEVYKVAVEERYRFFSFGDAMFIE